MYNFSNDDKKLNMSNICVLYEYRLVAYSVILVSMVILIFCAYVS